VNSSIHKITDPFFVGHLKVSDLHSLYYEQVGNKDGIPIVFLHGGPGAGIVNEYRQFFDPKKFHVVLFDQRGAGKSRPNSELKENTTWNLVDDIECLREHLGIEKWHVFGGSWGSTLALVYAIKHPDRVLTLQLRGIFLGRDFEVKWLYQYGASEIYPDKFETFKNHVPLNEQGNLVDAYHKRITDSDEEVRLAAMRSWTMWELSLAKLLPDPQLIKAFDDPRIYRSFGSIGPHYFKNKMFFESDNWILENVQPIADIPCNIAQGRYDVITPVRSAWDLHKALPKSQLTIVPDAGHASFDASLAAQLVRFTNAI